jgi:hypothetical protein
MNVKIIFEKNVIYGVEAIQRNKNPGIFNKYCEYVVKTNQILVSVPSSIPNVTQNNQQWEDLINAYYSVINKAIEMKKNSVLIPELGHNLMWKDCFMAKAAREALLAVCDKCPDDFLVYFFVDKKNYKVWDEMMAF